MRKKPVEILNRYTSLPVAIDVLAYKRITLLSPETWEDRNDAFYLARYREEKKLLTLLAICFSTRSETFHHWKIFSGNSSGVCIQFDKNGLLAAFSGLEGFRYREMDYRLVRNLANPSVEEWPFLKRKAFNDEREFRIIYEDKISMDRFKHVYINLDTVNKITLSPWLSDTLVDSIRNVIKTIDGCEKLTIKHSTLIDNSGWKRAIKGMVESGRRGD